MSNFDLFPAAIDPASIQRDLGQYDTPAWVAEAIIERVGLKSKVGGMVIEPTCGTGAFLSMIPSHLDAIGVEIDPIRAEIAAASSGRRVIVGDFRTVALPAKADCVIGNPPFEAKLVEDVLQRSYALLEREGEACFILPAYIFQTTTKVLEYKKNWSIYQELMPRNLFPNLKLPLIFARFVKDGRRVLSGFFLYEETYDVQGMPAPIKEALATGRKPSAWRSAVIEAMQELGGRAKLPQLYNAMMPRRPTDNPWWKNQVRKVLQEYPDFASNDGFWVLQENAA
jgi:hypothetical protein